VTTKARINEFSPFPVWSERGTWYARIGEQSIPFADGITIYPSGKVKGAGKADTSAKEQKLRKAANAYARAFVDKLYAGEIPAPSAGDCWHCCMRDQDGKEWGGKDHILSHLKEKYYVPSLLVNALKAFGASIAATQTAHALMLGQPEHAFSTRRDDFLAAQIQKCIRRYVLRQLSIAA